MLTPRLGRSQSRLKGIAIHTITMVCMATVLAMDWVMAEAQAMGDMDTERTVMLMEDGVVAMVAIMVRLTLCKIIHIVIFTGTEDTTLVGSTGTTEVIIKIILMQNRKMKLIWRMLRQWHNQSKEDLCLQLKVERNYGKRKHLIKCPKTTK